MAALYRKYRPQGFDEVVDAAIALVRTGEDRWVEWLLARERAKMRPSG